MLKHPTFPTGRPIAPGNTPAQGRQVQLKHADAKRMIENRKLPGKVFDPKKKPRGASLASPTDSFPPIVDLEALAEALDNDADKIYHYVANSIEFLPTFGSQKGALGALLDRQGNSFDQSALMVQLLTEAGYTAKLMFGELRITAADAGAWLGTEPTDAWASRNLLANGGIPSSVEWHAPSSTYYVILSHVFVKCLIGGTNYMFDPSRKTYSVTAGIDIETVTGYDETDLHTAAFTGATVTADYVQDVNVGNLETELDTYVDNLRTWIDTNKPDATVDDIIGGRVIVPTTSILRNTSLPGLKPATTPTEWSAVPNAYKTVFSVLYDTISESFYSEDLAAKRLSITFNGSNEGELRLDGTLIATSDPQGSGTWNSVLLTIEHPYGATWADQSFWQTVWAGKPYLIANSWGNTTKEMAYYHQKKLQDNKYAGGLDDDENVVCESLSVLWHTWAANKSIMASMIGRMNMCTTVLHHQVGLVGHYDSPFTDLGGIMWSSSALDNDYNRIYATDTMLALRGVGFESASIAQIPNIGGVSSDTVIGAANTAGQKIYHADSSNWTTDVRPNLVNYTTQTLDDIENWYINYGWKIIIHEDGETVQNAYNGFGFFAVGQYGGTVGIINGYLLGGTGEQIQLVADFNQQAAQNQSKYGPDMTYGGTELEHIVDGFSGEFKYRHTDISIGSGPYPQSLHYTRSFDNRRRTQFNEVGYGWCHNYQITAHMSSDGYDALGEQAASNAAPNLIDLMVGILNFQNGFYGPGFTLVSLANLYAQRAVTSNVVTIRDGENVYKFSQLMGLNGGFLGPKGLGLGLTYQTSGALLMQNLAGDKWYFNLQNFIDRIEYASGITVTFTYTGLFPRLASVSNNFGLTLNFTYGNIGGLVYYITKVTDSAFREVNYDFDSGLKLKEYYDALNQKTEYFYDSKGRLTEYKFPNTYSVINEFDDLDRVVKQTNPGGQESTFRYLGNQTIVMRGTRVINTYYNADGKPRMVIDGLETTYYTYDGLGRKVFEWQSTGGTTGWQYDLLNRVLTKTQNPGAGGGSTITESWTYGTTQDMWTSYTDPLGGVHYRTINAKNLVDDETSPAVGGVSPVKTWDYDSYGRMTSYEDPTGVVTQYNYGSMNSGPHLTSQVHDVGGLDLTTTYGYDSVGNKTSVTNPRGYASTYTWDVLRRPLSKTATSPFGYVTEWTYDSQGNVLTQRRSLGAGWQTETRTYSPLNKVLTITDPRSKVTTNTYDAYGRLATTTDAESRVTQFFYDLSNRLTSVIDANSVTAEQRTYTDSGQLYQLTDARSNVSTYTYDGHDRKKRCTYPDSSYEEWTYDAAGNVTLFRSRSGDTITSTFDALNRLSTRTPQGQATETFTYDLAGRLLTAGKPTVSGDPSTGSFSRGYDSAKRLTSETNPQSQVVSYELDDNGNVTKITYPDSYYVEKVYDQLDRLTTVKLNGSSSSAAAYSYDDLSRRTNLTFLNGVDQDYGYDIGDNLTSMDLAWTGSSASWTYGYNDVEEMTSQAFSDTGFQWRPAAAATVNYGTANNLNQYPTVGGVTRTMNSDGCLTGDGTWTYSYDGDNMMTQAAKTGVTVDFVYDPFHRNIRKDDGTNKTRYIYAGDQILAEYNDTSGALINRHVYGFEADDPIIQVTSGGTVTYNTQDHVGSIIARTDSSGGILSKYKYAPFGESPSLSGTIFGFTGQRFDPETGLYHFKARYYDPVTGRFLQPDPISYGDGLNLYRYVSNNPLGNVDSSGTQEKEVSNSSEPFLVGLVLDSLPIVSTVRSAKEISEYVTAGPHSPTEAIMFAMTVAGPGKGAKRLLKTWQTGVHSAVTTEAKHQRHHFLQGAIGNNWKGYDYNKAPVISVPTEIHRKIKTVNTVNHPRAQDLTKKEILTRMATEAKIFQQGSKNYRGATREQIKDLYDQHRADPVIYKNLFKR